MSEVITDPKMRAFVHSPVSKEFGLTVAQVAEKCKSYGRFSAWLNGNISLITEVLNEVKARGVSPAFFASYEKTEGYNSSWGWLNHTRQVGTYLNDATSVSNWIVTQSNNTTDNPAWIDYANYKDFVPSAIKQAGNADFSNMTGGSIGKVIIAGTAAATWEVYYPLGLQKDYNGVQNYGAPINGMITTIEEWGGVIEGDSSGGESNSQLINQVVSIVNSGRNEIEGSIDLSELETFLKSPLFKTGSQYYSNGLFKATLIYENMMSLQIQLDDFDLKLELNVDDVFDNLITQIRTLEDSGSGDPEPEPDENMFFPVNVNEQGINFWVPPNQPDMDYGGERSGRLHWAYDIGTLGNANVSCHAVRSGTVVSVNADNLGTVIIKHSSDPYYTQYMHLKLGAFTVSAGDTVIAGQKIGVVGGTGGYDIHLHFAVSINGTFGTEADTINPRPYLKITGNNVTSLPNPI